MLQFAEDGNMMWLFNVLNVIFIIILAFVDFFYFLGVAKDRKRCTNREWRQGTKGFRNTVTWEGIRKYVPKYLYVHHIITLSVMSLAILSPLFSLMGLYMRQTYVCLTGSVSGAYPHRQSCFFGAEIGTGYDFLQKFLSAIANRAILWYTEITKSVWIFLSFRLTFRHTPCDGCMVFF